MAGGLAAALIMGAVASIPLGVAASRLKADRFVLATLGFQALATSVFENWIDLTGGPLGIGSVTHVDFGFGVLPENLGFAFLCFGFTCLTLFISGRLSRGPFGWVLHCIRDDEVVAISLGKNVRRVKFQVLAATAALAAGAGGLYAFYATYVDPYSFTLNESILIAAMAIIGGHRSQWGPVFGASILVLLPEGLRFLGLPHSVAAPLYQAIFGSVFVWIVMARPQGAFGTIERIASGRVKARGVRK